MASSLLSHFLLFSGVVNVQSAWTGHFQWAAHPDFVLEVNGFTPDKQNQKPLDLWNFVGNENQVFTLTDDGRIHWTSNHDFCLEVKDHRTDNGAIVQLNLCEPYPANNQKWNVGLSGAGAITLASDPSKCVDVRNGDVKTGTSIQIYDCMPSDANQYFTAVASSGPVTAASVPSSPTISSGLPVDFVVNMQSTWTGHFQWAAHPDFVLEVNGFTPDKQNQKPLDLWNFVGNENQVFTLTDDRIHWTSNPNFCLEVKDHRTDNGAIVQLNLCEPYPANNQQWKVGLSGAGAITLASDPSKCVDVRNGDVKTGTSIQIFDCMPYGANQYFTAVASSGPVPPVTQWIDQGRGCCGNPGPNRFPIPLYDRTIGSLQKCQEQCLSLSGRCSVITYYHDTTWCTAYDYKHGQCPVPLRQGSGDCGSSGLSAETWYYKTAASVSSSPTISRLPVDYFVV